MKSPAAGNRHTNHNATRHARVAPDGRFQQARIRDLPSRPSRGLSRTDAKVKSDRRRDVFPPGIATQKRFFDRVKGRLLKDPAYEEKWVAVAGKKVVDADADEITLVERVARAYPKAAIFIGKVSLETPTYELSSPELEP